MHQKLGDQSGARALHAAAHSLLLPSPLPAPVIDGENIVLAHDACVGWKAGCNGGAEEVRNFAAPRATFLREARM